MVWSMKMEQKELLEKIEKLYSHLCTNPGTFLCVKDMDNAIVELDKAEIELLLCLWKNKSLYSFGLEQGR